MPKQRITKEMVVNAAFEIARSSGMEQVLVKNIADRIGCSVQPIYKLLQKHGRAAPGRDRPGEPLYTGIHSSPR